MKKIILLLLLLPMLVQAEDVVKIKDNKILRYEVSDSIPPGLNLVQEIPIPEGYAELIPTYKVMNRFNFTVNRYTQFESEFPNFTLERSWWPYGILKKDKMKFAYDHTTNTYLYTPEKKNQIVRFIFAKIMLFVGLFAIWICWLLATDIIKENFWEAYFRFWVIGLIPICMFALFVLSISVERAIWYIIILCLPWIGIGLIVNVLVRIYRETVFSARKSKYDKLFHLDQFKYLIDDSLYKSMGKKLDRILTAKYIVQSSQSPFDVHKFKEIVEASGRWTWLIPHIERQKEKLDNPKK
jgi:hypothetical protein